MRAHPVTLEQREVIDAIERHWDLNVDTLTYVPKGGGSYHWLAGVHDGRSYFVTVDDLDRKPWLGTEREAAFDGLRVAFDAALALHEQAHLAFVVAPVRTCDGRAVHRLSSRYSVAVFPFLDGRAGEFHDQLPPDERDQVLDRLAGLHQATHLVPRAARRGPELPGRSQLEEALDDTDHPWSGGPFAEPARQLLAVNAPIVIDWLASFDEMTARVTQSDVGLVITHGEPHPANFMRVGDDLLLIDWDTVGLAPPERDLWMLDHGAPNGFSRYAARTGRHVDPDAINLYRLTWTLADVAAFVTVLESTHESTADTEKAWGALTHYLP